MKDHKHIWLEPACEADPSTGRCWAENEAWSECPDGVKPTKYVRADIADDLMAALGDIQWFCDNPNKSENGESLAMGLARLLPAARAALAKARGET